jgi:glycosyltransferase involved in cell wall biosynthesis
MISQNVDLVILAHQPRVLKQWQFYNTIVRQYRRFLPYRLRDPDPETVGGHYGVTRSLVVGLRSIGADFAYGPTLDRTKARVAIVLAGQNELRAAIAWKRRGGCQKLFAGPNVVELPNQGDGILLSQEIDRVVVASDKVCREYESIASSLCGKIVVWPAGVDENYWKPRGTSPRDTVLIYNKRMPALAHDLEANLQQHGFRCRVFNYGGKRNDKYRLRDFRAALERSYACVFLSLSEPQGIAAAEAWSMDCPTFAFRERHFTHVATIPYLSQETGRYWSRPEELLLHLANFKPERFQPRAWVVENMTDEICARKLLTLIS